VCASQQQAAEQSVLCLLWELCALVVCQGMGDAGRKRSEEHFLRHWFAKEAFVVLFVAPLGLIHRDAAICHPVEAVVMEAYKGPDC